MKEIGKVTFTIAAVLLMQACTPNREQTTQSTEVQSIVAATFEALTAVAPAAPTQSGISISYANVSLVLPPEIATGVNSRTIPATGEENGGPWGVAPEHIEFELTGYGLPPGSFQQMRILVYPAQEYAAVNSHANTSLQRLQAVLSNPSAAVAQDALPNVPFINAGPFFAAQIRLLDFKGGSGVRLITQYGQAPGPAQNNATFYHFQGLTGDGKYYLIAVLPIQAGFLPDGNESSGPFPADSIPFPGYNYVDPTFYDSYYKAVTDKLDATAPAAFRPSLSVLDALVGSLQVSP